MVRNHSRMRPLTPYEPSRPTSAKAVRALVQQARADGQLAFDLPATGVPPAPRAGKGASNGTLGRRLLGRMVTAILEAHEGRRPPGQVRALLDPELYKRLMTRVRPGSRRHTVRSVHSCQPCHDVVEACATVHAGRRAFAIAVRFENSPSGWRCTRFDLLKPGQPDHRLSA